MADPAYRPITPRFLGRNAYIPENDPEFMRRQQEPSSYDLFKQSVIQNAYNEALRATGSEARAMEAANSVSRKMFRTELVGSVAVPEAAIAGAGRAVNVAKGLFGREKAAEAASPLLLPAPRRNSMLPEERLPSASETPSVLRMEPDRVPSLANSQSLPRLEYDIPTIPSRGLPPARDVVSSPFDDIGRMAGEGGMADDAIMAARRMAQERVAAGEAAQARRITDMEDEGGSLVNEVLRKRALAAEEEAAYKARQLATADDEGMMAVRSPYASRQAAEEAAYQARIDDMMSEGGGGAISRTPPPGTRFTLGESSSSGVYRPDFTRPEGSRFGLPALRGSTDVVTTGSPAASANAGSGTRSFFDRVKNEPGLRNTLIAMGGLSSTLPVLGYMDYQQRAEKKAADRVENAPPAQTETAEIVAPNNPAPAYVNDYSKGDDEYKGYMVNDYSKGDDEYKSFMASSPASFGMTRDKFINLPGYEGEGGPAARPAPQRRPSVSEAPAAAAAEPSLRDRLFGGQDFQSNNRAVVSRPQGQMPDGAPQRATLNWGDSGSAADFFRADKAMQGLLRDKEEFVGMASGGAANGSNRSASGGKDAAIHKALEIIHHMMVNR